MTHCPQCGSEDRYTFKTRKIMRCKSCGADYTTTSQTRYAASKLNDAQRDLLVGTIKENPTMSSQKIADRAGVTQKTAWLWKARVLSATHGAAKGYYQGARKAAGQTKAVWKIRHVKPWPARRHAAFVSMWARGCPIKCMAAMFAVEPGTISNRASRHGLQTRSAA